MRNETPYLWGIEPDQTHLTHGAFRAWKGSLGSGLVLRRDSYAVEVCWISDGAVTCRTYQVSAANEVCAARIACRNACASLSKRATRIEAVDIEQIQRGDGHE